MEAVQPVPETTNNQTLPRDRLTTLTTELFASICHFALLDDDDVKPQSPRQVPHRRLRPLGLVSKAFLPFVRRAIFSQVTVTSDAKARQIRDLVLQNDGLGSHITQLRVTHCVGTGILDEEPSDSDSSDSEEDDDLSETGYVRSLSTEAHSVTAHRHTRSDSHDKDDISDVFPNRAVFTSFLKQLPRLQRLSVASDVGFWRWLLTPQRDDLLPGLEQLEVTVLASRTTLSSLAVLVGLKRYRHLFALKIIVPSNTKPILDLQEPKLHWVADLCLSGQHFEWAMAQPLVRACTRLERLVIHETTHLERLVIHQTSRNQSMSVPLSTLLCCIKCPHLLDTLSIRLAHSMALDRHLPSTIASFSGLTHLQLGRGVIVSSLLESIVGLKHLQELTLYAGSSVQGSDLLYILRHRPPRLGALNCYVWPSDYTPFPARVSGHAELTSKEILRVVKVAQDVGVEIKGYSERYAWLKVRRS
ncbi:hypothetical protein RTBOTA2_006690 [Rhodotorula toruloides]|nr:hypothetical protein RTBOTA2_006690 [Rhodotorula toruloides]